MRLLNCQWAPLTDPTICLTSELIEGVRGNISSVLKVDTEGFNRCTIGIRGLEEKQVMVIVSKASYKY